MLTKLLYALPEISIIFGIIHLSILYILSYEAPKVYAKTARLWLLVSLFSIITFYDKSYNFLYFENTSYTMLAKSLVIFFSYIILIISPSWFSEENKTGYKFWVYIFLNIITQNLIISSINLIPIVLGYCFLTYINYRLIDLSSPEVSKRHLKISFIVIIMLLGAFYYFYAIDENLTNFNNLSSYITEQNNDFVTYIISTMLIIPFLYLFGVFPFHLEKEDILGKTILPVAHFFTIVIPLMSLLTIIKLKASLFACYQEYLSFGFMVIGCLSIIIGAIGANARINLHRIYAHGSIYHFGICMILLSFFIPQADFISFIYILFYLISLNGLYLVFYNLKSHREFLSSQISLSGLAKTRPYTTRALLISVFSLLCLPPFVGFVAQFGYINLFLSQKSYILLIVALVFFLILAKSYLEIIKTAYFEQKIKTYDTENKIILLTTVFCMFLIVFISFNPYGLIEKLKDMFYVIYL